MPPGLAKGLRGMNYHRRASCRTGHARSLGWIAFALHPLSLIPLVAALRRARTLHQTTPRRRLAWGRLKPESVGLFFHWFFLGACLC